MIVYLAGPIDGVEVTAATEWRTKTAKELGDAGVSTFNPAGPFRFGDVTDKMDKFVIETNKSALAQCDVLLANLSGVGRGIGTIREIEYAINRGIQVIVVLPMASTHHSSLYDTTIVYSLVDAVDIIKKRHWSNKQEVNYAHPSLVDADDIN